MKILLAESFGMCFGVRDAIAQAENLAAAGPLTILGELVHNPLVRERLRVQGVAEGSLDDAAAGGGSSVMFTAHGISDVGERNGTPPGSRLPMGPARSSVMRTLNFACWSQSATGGRVPPRRSAARQFLRGGWARPPAPLLSLTN